MLRKSMKTIIPALIFASAIEAVLLGEFVSASTDELQRNVKLLDRIAFMVSAKYVEDVDPETLIKAGITGMLSTLDPSCDYSDSVQYQEQLKNSENQIVMTTGIHIAIKDGWLTVISTKEDTPAQRMGIRVGDRIIEINGRPTLRMTEREAKTELRGSKGSGVRLSVQKKGLQELMEYTVEIDSIPARSVPYYGITSEGIGYVKQTGFYRNAGNEVKEAVSELLDKNVKGLILDLRGNPGGLLDEAITIASIFLDQDRLVLETKGSKETDNRMFLTWDEPLCTRLPLAILVDKGSSAGSEIVAGAIQDWDRGIIIGDTTFGVGYVQQVFKVEEGGVLKLSVAECIIPSGRSIQREEGSGIKLTQGKPVFFTKRGRTVYGGGGIAPDITILDLELSPLVYRLLAQLTFSDFAGHYTATNPNPPKDFEVDDAMITKFQQFLEAEGFNYQTSSELKLEELKKTVDKEERSEVVIQQLVELEKLLKAERANDFERSKEFIKSQIKESILVKLYGQSAKYEGVWFKYHPQIKKAIQILSNLEEYKELLSAN